MRNIVLVLFIFLAEPMFSQVFNNEVKEDFISTFSKYLNVKEETIKERIMIMKCLNATEEEIVWYKNNIIRMDSVMHASIKLVKNDDYVNLAKLFEKERYDIYGHPHNDTYLCYELHLAMAMIYSITTNNMREYYEKFADLLEYSKMMIESVQANWDEPHPLYQEVLEVLKQIYEILENQSKIKEVDLLINRI